MQNKKVIISIVCLLLFGGSLMAQNYRTFSPYSRFGIGDIQGTQIGRGQQMGGTGIAQQSHFSLNDLNPAGIAGIDSLTFMLEGGVGYLRQNLSSSEGSAIYGNGNFNFFAFGFPLSKWAFVSMGLKPYSDVGYKISNQSSISQNEAYGEGSLSKGFFTLALKPISNLSVGISCGMLTGKITHYNYVNFLNDANAKSYGSKNEFSIKDFNVDFGAQYCLKIDDQRKWIFGATFTPRTTLNGDGSFIIKKGSMRSPNGDIFTNSDTAAFSKYITLQDNDYNLPLQFGLGATYEIFNKISTSLDYSFVNWSDTKFDKNSTKVKNSQLIALGTEYVPNDFRTDAILYRIRYRCGAYYKKEYIVVNDNQITDFGISGGFGIPLRRSKNFINLGVNWGQRGSLDNSLVLEKYLRFNIDFVIQERWFSKRKFD